MYGKYRRETIKLWEAKNNVIRKVESTGGRQNRDTSPAFEVWKNLPRGLLLKHKPAGKLRIYPGEKAFRGRKSVLARGISLCEDTPVSEGECGGPEELRDGQPGCNLQNAGWRWESVCWRCKPGSHPAAMLSILDFFKKQGVPIKSFK